MKNRAALGMVLLLAPLFCAAELSAQLRQVDPTGPLDANPMIGGDGSNAPVATDRTMNSQLYVTGQVTGLARFRGNVPYRADDQFGIRVPSADLSDFRARSVNSFESGTYGGYATRPYYSRGQTIIGSAGILSGQAAPGTNVPISQVPSAYAGISRELYVDAMKNYFQSTAPLAADLLVPPPQPMLLRQIPGYGFSIPSIAITAAQFEAPSADKVGLLGVSSGQGRQDLAMQLYLDRRRDDMIRQGGEEEKADADKAGPEAPGREPIAPLRQPMDKGEKNKAPANQDVFLDMLLQMRLATADANAPTTAPPVADANSTSGTEPPTGIVVRSLAGQARDAFNISMARAEKAVKDGRFYEASDLYDAAGEIRPENPLPVVGMGFALLGAGEPLSAAHKLRQAVRIFPPVMETRFDLKVLLGPQRVPSVLAQVENAASQSTPQAAALLNFLSAFLYRSSGDMAKAKEHAAKIKPALANNLEEDNVLAGYADFVLKGKRPPASKPK